MQRTLHLVPLQSNVLAVTLSTDAPDPTPNAQRRPRVACFGEALTVLVPAGVGPLEDETTFTRAIGGAELNVAIGLVAQGVAVDMITRVGDDGFGRHILAELHRYGVDTRAIHTDATRVTGMYVKQVETTGSRMLYYRAGSAASALSPDALREPSVAAALRDASIVHTTGITPALSADAAAAQDAVFHGRGAGQTVAFDLNWRAPLWRGRRGEGAALLTDFARRADIVLVGSDEAEMVFGTRDPARLRAALPEPGILVVKNDGAVATGFQGDHRIDVPARTAEVVEAIGAGDAFAAGLLAGILAGDALEPAIQRAHTTAVLALSGPHDHVGGAFAGQRA